MGKKKKKLLSYGALLFLLEFLHVGILGNMLQAYYVQSIVLYLG